MSSGSAVEELRQVLTDTGVQLGCVLGPRGTHRRLSDLDEDSARELTRLVHEAARILATEFPDGEPGTGTSF